MSCFLLGSRILILSIKLSFYEKTFQFKNSIHKYIYIYIYKILGSNGAEKSEIID